MGYRTVGDRYLIAGEIKMQVLGTCVVQSGAEVRLQNRTLETISFRTHQIVFFF